MSETLFFMCHANSYKETVYHDEILMHASIFQTQICMRNFWQQNSVIQEPFKIKKNKRPCVKLIKNVFFTTILQKKKKKDLKLVAVKCPLFKSVIWVTIHNSKLQMNLLITKYFTKFVHIFNTIFISILRTKGY